MNVYYLSENIYLQDNILYKNKKIIKKYNWHRNLNELGWTKLPLQLIKKLNTYSDIKYKNSQYGMLDCGQDGSCFFHCIAYALNTNEIYKDEPYVYNSHDLRNILANYITEKLFNQIIEIYKILKDNDELCDTWNPYNIKIKEFKNQYDIYNTMEKYNPEKFTIILIYENEYHFKLLGNFQENN